MNSAGTTISSQVLDSQYMVFAGIIRKFDPKGLERDMIKKWMRGYRKSIMGNISWYASNECIMEVFKYFDGDTRFCDRLIRQIGKGNPYRTINDVFLTHSYSEIKSFLVNEASVKVEKFIDFQKLKVCFSYIF